jgi:hypothetical protein
VGEAVIVCVGDTVWLAEYDTPQPRKSAAIAAAESAVSKMRALLTVPCHNSEPAPFQPMYTPGLTGVMSAVSEQDFTMVLSTKILTVFVRFW